MQNTAERFVVLRQKLWYNANKALIAKLVVMLSIPYRWFFYFYIEQAEVREETFFESTLPGALKAKSNGNDRRQWRKQGVAVGAAACKIRVPPKARSRCREPQPGYIE